ncbi:MAG: hypothetical protein ACRD5H_17825, partial [Nitrososphaerales archaeon]
VIATVILVAVAVVIAAALAGFSSSLFGTYSSAGAAVVVKSNQVDTFGTATISLTNTGNVDDELLSVSVAPFGPGTIDAGSPSPIVAANSDADGIIFNGLAGGGTFTAGENLTVRMVMKSGVQLTQSVIVTA